MRTNVSPDGKIRCFGNGPEQGFYAKYHDTEWGIPVYDDRLLFEMLSLEGAQAGLSWETVLKKRAGYRKLFHRFSINRVASMSDEELDAIVLNPAIIRHRLKVYSVRKNARVVLEIKKEQGSFSDYLWRFVNHDPIVNRPKHHSDVPASTEVSELISKDLKRRGMSFVGPTIVYAFMQACGMVNDHVRDCWLAPSAKKTDFNIVAGT